MEKKTTTETQYVIHVNYEYLYRMSIQRGCDTAEKKDNLFKEIVNGITERLADSNSTEPLLNYTFKDEEGVDRKAWYVEILGKGNCAEVEIEHEAGVPFKKFFINKDGSLDAQMCVYIFTYIDNKTNQPLEVIVVTADDAEKAELLAEGEIDRRRCEWRNSDYRRISWMMDEYLAPTSGTERLVYTSSEAVEASGKKDM